MDEPVQFGLNGAMEKKAVRHRSPAYPAIHLSAALERVKQFYGYQRSRPAPVSAAVELWGFKPTSGSGGVTIAALKQFGLMAESGVGEGRKVQLTDLALRIIQDDREPSPERDNLIKQAALSPKIYAEMWQEWGASFVADATMRFFLVHDKKYNETSVRDLIADYKDTIAFAKLADDDKVPDAEGEQDQSELADVNEISLSKLLPPPPKGATLMEGERELTAGILSKTAKFRLLVSGEIGVKEIERLIAKLQIDKEILADSNDNKEPQTKE